MSAQQISDIVKTNAIEYKFAILWFCLFSVNALCSSLMIAMANVTWSTLDEQGKVMVFVAIAMNWTNTVMAFLSSQAKRIKKTGELFPITDDSNTQQFTKTEVQQTTVQQSSTLAK